MTLWLLLLLRLLLLDLSPARCFLLLQAPALLCFPLHHRLASFRHQPLLLLTVSLLLLQLLLSLLLLLMLEVLLRHLLPQHLSLPSLTHQFLLDSSHFSLLLGLGRLRRRFRPLFCGSDIALLPQGRLLCRQLPLHLIQLLFLV